MEQSSHELDPASSLSISLQAIHAEQLRLSTVIAGMQRDVGDVVIEQAAQGVLLRGGNGSESLILRVAVGEQRLTELKENILDHRRVVESQNERLQATMEAMRKDLAEAARDTAQQRQQSLIQSISWILVVVGIVISTALTLMKH